MSLPRLWTRIFALSLGLFLAAQAAAAEPDTYPPNPDSVRQPGVSQGEMRHFTFDHSAIYPGTTRDYWVYVPAQYDGKTPACVYVDQDGRQWKAEVVFDNLIAKKQMPVTIGVFVTPGVVPAVSPAALPRFNRSFEYDGMGDDYARFILDELLPDVATKKASDGRALLLSQSGNDRAIGGSSSGAMAAFTAAWLRPDAFSRVFSAVGSYVDLRGGEVYPSLIRKYEPKPIRVFLQSGTNDNNHYGGDWWMANQAMERSLEFSGYEVSHVWGEGGHNGRQGTAIFPDAMRWLWQGWPQPVTTGVTKNAVLHDILLSGEGWAPVNGTYPNAGGLMANAKGEVVIVIYPDGNDTSGSVFKIGPDGQLANSSIKFFGSHFEDVLVAHNGNIYRSIDTHNRIYLKKPNGAPSIVNSDGPPAGGLALSPDQTYLYVSDAQSPWIYSYQIAADGSLQYGQKYYWLEVSPASGECGAQGMAVDRDGRLYVATDLGVQVCDQAGRVNAILPVPGGKVSSVCFGGANFDILYAAAGDKIYGRKLNVVGQPAWAAPVKPAPPKL
jgi:enterochelin esterase-like enzyme